MFVATEVARSANSVRSSMFVVSELRLGELRRSSMLMLVAQHFTPDGVSFQSALVTTNIQPLTGLGAQRFYKRSTSNEMVCPTPLT